MKFKDWLIDYGKFWLRIIIVGALLFGPAMISVKLQDERYFFLYIVSALIFIILFLKR